MSLPEKHLSIVYHSPYGHTAKVASAIASGAEVMGVKVHVMNIEHIDWDVLDASQGIIFGSPTYMGSVTADFKKFMDSTSIVKLLYYSYKIRKKLEITHRLSRSTILYAYV